MTEPQTPQKGPYAVELAPGVRPSLHQLGDLTRAVEDAVAGLTTAPVDLRILNGTPAPFRHAVLAGWLLCDHDPGARRNLFARTVSEYLDFLPTQDLLDRAILRG